MSPSDSRPIISLSTCWNSARHTDGREMLEEIAGLGFEYAELGHGTRLSLLPGILDAVEAGIIQISSVHNFCPLPPGVMGANPNLYMPTATDRQQRYLWQSQTLKTIQCATQVKAPFVVMHSGEVKFMLGNPADKAHALKAGKLPEQLANDKLYLATLRSALDKVRQKSNKILPQVVRGYQQVVTLAQEAGVCLGIENREDICEIPIDDEMHGFLKRIGSPDTAGYWHDTGHAQLKEMMRILPHHQLLSENANRLFGMHLNDVTPKGKDHRAPGDGIIDWEMVSRFFRPHHTLVIEVSPSLESEDISRAFFFVQSLVARMPS